MARNPSAPVLRVQRLLRIGAPRRRGSAGLLPRGWQKRSCYSFLFARLFSRSLARKIAVFVLFDCLVLPAKRGLVGFFPRRPGEVDRQVLVFCKHSNPCALLRRFRAVVAMDCYTVERMTGGGHGVACPLTSQRNRWVAGSPLFSGGRSARTCPANTMIIPPPSPWLDAWKSCCIFRWNQFTNVAFQNTRERRYAFDARLGITTTPVPHDRNGNPARFRDFAVGAARGLDYFCDSHGDTIHTRNFFAIYLLTGRYKSVIWRHTPDEGPPWPRAKPTGRQT